MGYILINILHSVQLKKVSQYPEQCEATKKGNYISYYSSRGYSTFSKRGAGITVLILLFSTLMTFVTTLTVLKFLCPCSGATLWGT